MNPVVVVKGSDPVLMSDAVSEVLATVVGDDDRNEVLDTFAGDEYELADAIIAANSVSMFGTRVVAVRNAARFGVAELGPMLSYLENPNPSTVLVVVWERPNAAGARSNPFPKRLGDAVKTIGGVIRDCDVGATAKLRQGWIEEQLRSSTLKFAPQTVRAIADHVGEDVAMVKGLVRLLEGVFAPLTKVTPQDLEPYLGSAGSIAPWDLTDAIDAGNVALAVSQLRRMTGDGQRHPLAVFASLITHFQKMATLDGAGVATEQQAAALLCMKGNSTFPAKKALNQARKLGSQRIGDALVLLAQADGDLHGMTGLDPSAVLEIAVARLARMSR